MPRLLETYQMQPVEVVSSVLGGIASTYQRAKHIPVARFDQIDEFPGLEIDELKDLAVGVLMSRNFLEAYELLALTPKDGRLTYYDRVIGVQNSRAHDVIEEGLAKSVRQKMDAGLDIGTGTGVTALILAPHCRILTAIDLSQPMLTVAEQRLQLAVNAGELEAFQTKVMDCLTLDFPNNNFDLITEHSIASYLQPEEQVDFYKGIHRILKVGGKFFKYASVHWVMEEAGQRMYTASPRAELAGLVSDSLIRLSAQVRPNFSTVPPDEKDFISVALPFEISGFQVDQLNMYLKV